MKKASLFSIVLFLICFHSLQTGCKKENKSSDGIIIPGTISLEVHCVHHSWDISGIMIYLQRNATDFPGKDSSVYEFKGKADGYGKYTFEKLYPGNYYVYASGFDDIWGSNVTGYMPVVLNKDHLVNNQLSITLIVSE